MTEQDKKLWNELVEGDLQKESFISYKMERDTLKSIDLACCQFDIHENNQTARYADEELPLLSSCEYDENNLLVLVTDLHNKVKPILYFILNEISERYYISLQQKSIEDEDGANQYIILISKNGRVNKDALEEILEERIVKEPLSLSDDRFIEPIYYAIK